MTAPPVQAGALPDVVSAPKGINLGSTSFYDGFGRTQEGWTWLQYGRFEDLNRITDGRFPVLRGFSGGMFHVKHSLTNGMLVLLNLEVIHRQSCGNSWSNVAQKMGVAGFASGSEECST